MGEAARNFLDRLVLRVGGKAPERARHWSYAVLACVNADGAARLVLSFKNHIRRRGGTAARTAARPGTSGSLRSRKHPYTLTVRAKPPSLVRIGGVPCVRNG